MLQDDPSISDDENLYRGIRQDWLKDDRIVSSAFKHRPTKDKLGHVSVDRASLCSPKDTLGRLAGNVGVAQLTAGAARKYSDGVASTPTRDNPAHAEILRKPQWTESQARKAARSLATECTWAIEPR